MTISDLAEYLQVSKSSLYKLVQCGRVPGQKVGKHWRFSREAINRWLETPTVLSSLPGKTARSKT
ncbi:MAG: helix-turn-helix domain-containing protein [Phycisphaerales bacterium]|nr:helix-turn-helix domain-containing protein [Phycisphaerales bacterium]